jgi:hypothetical protein
MLEICFQLQETSVEQFEKTVKDDDIPILISTLDDSPLQLDEYVEFWRVRIWDYGFAHMFRGKDSFSKTKAFKDQKQCDLAVRRVLFRLVQVIHRFMRFPMTSHSTSCHSHTMQCL